MRTIRTGATKTGRRAHREQRPATLFYHASIPALAVSLWLGVVVCITACTREFGVTASKPTTFSQAGESSARSEMPASPATQVDTNYERPTGRTISVTGSGDTAARAFQAALDSARSGDVIAIEPGSIVTGNFVLPKKQGSGWTVI